MFKFAKSIIKSVGSGLYRDPYVQRAMARHPGFSRFVRNRLHPDEKFGLHLTLGVFATLFFVFLFFKVIEDYIGQETLIQSDLRIINLVQIFRVSALNNPALLITYLGKWQLVFMGTVFLSIIFAMVNWWHRFVALIISVAGGEFFVWLVKNIVERPRPPLVNALTPETSFSFPSGHAFVAISFYGLLAYFVLRAERGRFVKILTGVAAVLLIALIGLSRIYLGAHWPSDVLASYAAGGAWLMILVTILETRRKFKPYIEREPIATKPVIAVLTVIFSLVWASLLIFYFLREPLKPTMAVAETPTLMNAENLENDLFDILPKFSETITGQPMEPMNSIFVGTYGELEAAFRKAGWVPADPVTVQSMWRLIVSSTLGRPYPEAPGTPSFWNTRPNDFSFEQPTPENSVNERHHIHFWRTSVVADGRPVWFATAHFDEDIKTKFKLNLPAHTIDPAIDKERDRIKRQLSLTDLVESIREFPIVEPTLGSNQGGDLFFTDGRAYIFFLREGV